MVQSHSHSSREASLNLSSSRHCLPGCVCQKHQISGPPSCTGWLPSSLINSRNGSQGSHMNGGGGESFWMAASLCNYWHAIYWKCNWSTLSHGTQVSPVLTICFLDVLKEGSVTSVLQLQQFLNMSLLKESASSPKPHHPGQRSHGGDGHWEVTLWQGPGSATEPRDGSWVPSSFHPSTAEAGNRELSTVRLTQPHLLSLLLYMRQSQSTYCKTVIS